MILMVKTQQIDRDRLIIYNRATVAYKYPNRRYGRFFWKDVY